MDTSAHTIGALFEQLGLPASSDDIDAFLNSHHLLADVALAEASFWNASQAEFLRCAIEDDADWAEVVDQLDALLRN